MHTPIILLLAAGLAFGQFENLATSENGDVIYFTTRLRPRGTDHLPFPKVYRLDKTGVRLVAQAPYGLVSVEMGGWFIESASVSGDGRVVSVNSSTPCRVGAICRFMPQEFSTIWIGDFALRPMGRTQISRGGRHALLWRETGFGIVPGQTYIPGRGVSHLDLVTSALVAVGEAPAKSGHWISRDGTILAAGGNKEWVLVAPSGERRSIGPAPDALRAVVSDDASFVVYQEREGDPVLRIRERDGRDRLLAAAGVSPSISSKPSKVFFLSRIGQQLQAFLQDPDAFVARQVTFEPEGLSEAVITGDGNSIIATTALGRLITVNLSTRAIPRAKWSCIRGTQHGRRCLRSAVSTLSLLS